MFPAPDNLVVHDLNDTHKSVQWNRVNMTSNVSYLVCTNVTNMSRCENTSEPSYCLPWETAVSFQLIVRAVNDSCAGNNATFVYMPQIGYNIYKSSPVETASLDSSLLSVMPEGSTSTGSIVVSKDKGKIRQVEAIW